MSETITVTPEQFVAFNEELIALLKAKVPLELGLQEGTTEETSAVERVTKRLSQSLQKGATLVEALEAESQVFPSAYCRIVEAGVRSGNLTAALEAVVGFIRDYLAVRRQITLALIYPLTVLLAAYGLFLTILAFLIGEVGAFYSTFRMSVPASVECLLWLRGHLAYWAWIVPVLVGILFLYWLISVRTVPLAAAGAGGLWNWVPGLGAMERNFRWSLVSRLLSLLVEHKNPFPESLVLATGIVGDARMLTSARQAAGAMQRGDDIEGTLREFGGFPPFLKWIIVHNYRSPTLSRELILASEMYQARAEGLAEWVRFYFPVLAAVLIGGGVTLFYCLAVFLPLTSMLHSLSG